MEESAASENSKQPNTILFMWFRTSRVVIETIVDSFSIEEKATLPIGLLFVLLLFPYQQI